MAVTIEKFELLPGPPPPPPDQAPPPARSGAAAPPSRHELLRALRLERARLARVETR